MTPGTAAAIATRRRRELDRIRSILRRRWVLTENPALVVSCWEVAAYVAAAIGKPVQSWPIHNDVELAARALDWVVIRRGSKKLFRGVREKSMTMAESLAASKELRDRCFPLRKRIQILAARARREAAKGGAEMAKRTRQQLAAARRAAREKYRDGAFGR